MQLNLICLKDELRPVLGHVYVTSENAVATNGHVLGVIPTNHIFNRDFVLSIPEDGMLIHAEDWKKITQYESAAWKGPNTIKLHDSKKRSIIIETFSQEEVAKFPEFERLIPTQEKRQAELNKVGIDASNALLLQKALGFLSLAMQFSGFSGAIHCTDASNREETAGRHGILMPIKLT
jgi:DNA polymerase III sliding clamp (beta) subunit (PCNA family)